MGTEKETYDRQYYDNIFLREGRNTQRNRNRIKVILSHQTGGRLLEIGCGKGEFLRVASQHFEVEGIDISRHAVQTLRDWTGGKIRNENIVHSQLPAETYQVIAAFNILEHIPDPQPIVTKLFSALKPGGLLIGSVPFNSAFLGRIHTFLTNIFDKTHCSTFPPEQWMRIFRQSGFEKPVFFGEYMFGKNRNGYLTTPTWRYLALNLMFACVKE
jgi:SAM-dependent methyltransferase